MLVYYELPSATSPITQCLQQSCPVAKQRMRVKHCKQPAANGSILSETSAEQMETAAQPRYCKCIVSKDQRPGCHSHLTLADILLAFLPPAHLDMWNQSWFSCWVVSISSAVRCITRTPWWITVLMACQSPPYSHASAFTVSLSK